MSHNRYKLQHYARSRRAHKPAYKALEIARQQAQIPCYTNEQIWSHVDYSWNKPNKDGYAWVESLPACGLRFVGYADEICSPIQHKGWCTGEDCFDSETFRGAVVQRRSHDGVPVYLHGYKDPHNDGAYYLAILPIHWTTGDKGETDPCCGDGARNAAMLADSMAEHHAELEREYQRTWRKAQEARELLNIAIETGKETLSQLRMVKSLQNGEGLATYGLDPSFSQSLLNCAVETAKRMQSDYAEQKKSAFDFIDEWRPSKRETTLYGAWQDSFGV